MFDKRLKELSSEIETAEGKGLQGAKKPGKDEKRWYGSPLAKEYMARDEKKKAKKKKPAKLAIVEEGAVHKLRLPKTDEMRQKLKDIGHKQYVEHEDHIGIYSKSSKAVRRVAEMLGGGARRSQEKAAKKKAKK